MTRSPERPAVTHEQLENTLSTELHPGSMCLVPMSLPPIVEDIGLKDNWQVVSYLNVYFTEQTRYAIVNNVQLPDNVFLVPLDSEGRAGTSNNNGQTTVESFCINSTTPTHITAKGIEQNTNITVERGSVFASLLYDPASRVIHVVNQSHDNFSPLVILEATSKIEKNLPTQTVLDLLNAVRRGSFALFNEPQYPEDAELTLASRHAWRASILNILDIYLSLIHISEPTRPY